jgi:hypothetical protein
MQLGHLLFCLLLHGKVLNRKIFLYACSLAKTSYILKHVYVFVYVREICSYQRYRKRQKVKEAVIMLNEYERQRSQGLMDGEHVGEPTET